MQLDWQRSLAREGHVPIDGEEKQRGFFLESARRVISGSSLTVVGN
jgi:hypothetical protein